MIYVVTTQILPESDKYVKIDILTSLGLLEPLREVGLDTETGGLDPYTSELLSIQLGCKEFQIVIDCTTIDPAFYKEYLESDRLFILWNAKFDIKFFLHKRIIIKNIYDGFLAEKLLWMGYPSGLHSMSLGNAGWNYCGVQLDKSIRGQIIYKGLSEAVIEYGANDVKYLSDIKNAQAVELDKKGLSNAIIYENHFVSWIAYTEYCGVKLDVEKWRAKMQKDEERLKSATNCLNSWIVKNYSTLKNGNKYIKYDRQGDLFSGFKDGPECIINWSSSHQVIPLFEELGFNLLVPDKENGGMKKSVDAKVITPQKHLSQLALLYLDYKEAEKVTSTYGKNVINQINPITGRIHTNFNQLGTDTGRLSSGGKDKQNKMQYINLQNLPRDAETRSCFVAEEGNLWISADYSGQESRVIADLTQDQSMIDLFIHGNGDLHSLAAKMTFPKEIGDCPLEDIPKKFKSFRQEAKGVEFAIAYGGDHNTIAQNSGKSVEECQIIYNNFMDGFKGIAEYQKKQRKFVMQYGFILINPITGHKAFIYDFDELKSISKQFNPSFWEEYKADKASNKNTEIVQDVRKYFKRKSASEKQAINYPSQGTGALQFKLAMYYFYKYLIDNNLLFKVKMCIPCHDEMNIEVPETEAVKMEKVLIDCMERGGEFFVKSVKMPAEATTAKCWVH